MPIFVESISIQKFGLFIHRSGQYEQKSLNAHTHVLQKVIDTVKGDFTRDRQAAKVKDDVELIPEHIEYGHRTEHDRGAEFALHDDSATGGRLSEVDSP